jgi:hypothetical protein
VARVLAFVIGLAASTDHGAAETVAASLGDQIRTLREELR